LKTLQDERAKKDEAARA